LTHIDDILAKLSPVTVEKFRLAKDISKSQIPTASIGMNILLGGGIGIGKQSTFWGNQSAGKSALWLQSIALNQSQGRGCAYIDAERTFDLEWATRLGVDVDELLVSQVSSIGDMTDISSDFIKAGVELIVVDSTSALMPKSFFEEGEMKPFEKTGQIGQFARELGQSCRMIQGENYSAAMVHISQVRMDLGNSFMPGMKPSGGKEAEHANSLTVRMFSSKSENKAIMGEIAVGDILLEEQIGRAVTWTIDKNKVNGHYGTGNYDLYFRGDFVGVDKYGELLDYGIKYGIVQKGGAWITIYNERLQGRPKSVAYVRDNPEIAEKLEGEIFAKSV